MAGTKEIKRRIKSIKNTKKITKAMEMVAASKMKRAVLGALASRLYAKYSWEILSSISKNGDKINHPFFTQRENKKILLILITSNRGLCGVYNTQVIRKTLELIKKVKDTKVEIDLVTIGKKGEVFMSRLGLNILSSFSDIGDNISFQKVLPISKLVLEEYLLSNYDQVLVAYTDFVSALVQKANIKQLLPINKVDLHDFIKSVLDKNQPDQPLSLDPKIDYSFEFEGDSKSFIEKLAEKLVQMQIYQMLLESSASEQSARMIAMKNSSDASSEMIEDLTLVFNKVRQSNITQEILEINAGMASLN
jgi:F-type H+-transporting ATPase subunit gamma